MTHESFNLNAKIIKIIFEWENHIVFYVNNTFLNRNPCMRTLPAQRVKKKST